ncbi:MAG: DUF115 domain-containing protein [Treponema sp.]|jgi:hypothetical protein|nr:DUF115 domain-containing protein [Treponema sp.]
MAEPVLEGLTAAANGMPTVLAGKRALHSRYNPGEEAERYIASLGAGPEVKYCILLEPGLGYLIPPLRKKCPAAKILVLHVSPFFSKLPAAEEAANAGPADAAEGGGTAVWSPGSGRSLSSFLEEMIPDTAAAAIRLIEWRPAQDIYGEEYLKLLRETVEYIKRADANRRTVLGFGRRWFRNALRNAAIIRRAVVFTPGTLPCIVTGAGPSLEEAVPAILQGHTGSCPDRAAAGAEKPGCFVLAAASSAPALLARGLQPDMVISTDGGGWALLHLYETLRPGGTILAAGLTAALPSQCAALPVLVISDGSLWQGRLLRSLGIPFISLSQRGTVTASALDLALALTGGGVFIAGTDLSHRDILTHARPYAFDRLREERADRFSPAYSQSWVRARNIAASGSHGIYAAWFKRRLETYPERLFTLGTNNEVFAALTGGAIPGGADRPFSVTAAGGPEPAGSAVPARPVQFTGQAVRGGNPAEILIEALEDPSEGPVIIKELGDLLFPGEADTEGAVREALAAARAAAGRGR